MNSTKDLGLDTTDGKPLTCLYYLRDKTVQENNHINKSIRDSEGRHHDSGINGIIKDEHSPSSNRIWNSNNFIKNTPASLMTSVNNNTSAPNILSRLNSLDCWDYTIELECLQGPEDLQLAAELGKTLLERNKELETTLKHHQNIIDDQAQEIIYLQKQTAALREVNDSRLKIYEQLEVGVQDLERSNHRLNVENNNQKKHVKTLVHNIETLECRCEELTKSLEDTKQTLTIERRKNERLLQEKNNAGKDQMGVRLRHHEKEVSNNSEGETESFHANTTNPENCSFAFQSSSATNNKNANSTGISESSQNESFNISVVGVEDNEELIRVVSDLETTKKALLSEQQRVGELEDQLVAIIQENQTLQGRLAQGANEEMKSVHEELSILEEVRQGNMCSRCLRACDDRLTVHDEASSIAPTEEDDDRSLLDMEAVGGGVESNGDTSSQAAYHRSAVTIKAECAICSNTTKYLHELPISLENILLDVWQRAIRKFNIMQWIAKILQWPALVIFRLLSSLPDEDDSTYNLFS